MIFLILMFLVLVESFFAQILPGAITLCFELADNFVLSSKLS